MTNNTPDITYPIAAVERDTGLGKDTLRAWERRYGFPQPLRDANGDRRYPAAQLARLRLIKRLVDRGQRPGKLLALDEDALEALAQRAFDQQAPWGRGAPGAGLADYLELCRLHRSAALRRALGDSLAQLGLRRFVHELAAPLITAVGDGWERGQLQVFEEHLFTEAMQNVLRVGIASAAPDPEPGGRPVILLATFPNEAHTLGLLMAEALFTLEGAQCVALGASTPVADIARAGAEADVVALSFSIGSHTAQMLAGLSDLAGLLPPHVEIWTGGAAAALVRSVAPRCRYVGLDRADRQVALWREERAQGTVSV